MYSLYSDTPASAFSRNLPQVNAFGFLPFARVQTREMCVSHTEAKSLKAVFFGFLQIKTLAECKEKENIISPEDKYRQRSHTLVW